MYKSLVLFFCTILVYFSGSGCNTVEYQLDQSLCEEVPVKTHHPCLSELTVNELDACNVHVLGDVTVDGLIINSCYEGSHSVGPAGPPGSEGSQGPDGIDLTSIDYLYASLLMRPLFIPLSAGEEAVVPVGAIASNEWIEIMEAGLPVMFECPADGLYHLSYELSPHFIVELGDDVYGVSAWIALIDGSTSTEILGSRVEIAEAYSIPLPFESFTSRLTNTFFASLAAGDLLQFRFANTPPIGNAALLDLLPSGMSEPPVVANLVITRIY